MWRFDLTYVWAGKDIFQAKQAQPGFEVEIEFVDKEQSQDKQYLAISLLLKLNDLLIKPATEMKLE